MGGENPEVGVMMAECNRAELLRSLSQYRENLDQIIDLIEQENWHNLEQILQTNSMSRPKFLNE